MGGIKRLTYCDAGFNSFVTQGDNAESSESSEEGIRKEKMEDVVLYVITGVHSYQYQKSFASSRHSQGLPSYTFRGGKSHKE